LLIITIIFLKDSNTGIFKCVFLRRHLGKCPPGTLRIILEDNIKTDLKKIDCEAGRWMEMAQDCAQWWNILAFLNLPVPLPQC
jgi:hypothetical protein